MTKVSRSSDTSCRSIELQVNHLVTILRSSPAGADKVHSLEALACQACMPSCSTCMEVKPYGLLPSAPTRQTKHICSNMSLCVTTAMSEVQCLELSSRLSCNHAQNKPHHRRTHRRCTYQQRTPLTVQSRLYLRVCFCCRRWQLPFTRARQESVPLKQQGLPMRAHSDRQTPWSPLSKMLTSVSANVLSVTCMPVP